MWVFPSKTTHIQGDTQGLDHTGEKTYKVSREQVWSEIQRGKMNRSRRPLSSETGPMQRIIISLIECTAGLRDRHRFLCHNRRNVGTVRDETASFLGHCFDD